MSASPSTKHRGRNVHSSSLSKKPNRENSSSKLNKNPPIRNCVNTDDIINNQLWRENENLNALVQKYFLKAKTFRKKSIIQRILISV